MIRIAIAVIGFLCAIFLPVWVPIIAALILAFWWRAWEAMLLGLFIDFMWSPAASVPWFMLGAIIIVWLLEPIRKEFLSR